MQGVTENSSCPITWAYSISYQENRLLTRSSLIPISGLIAYLLFGCTQNYQSREEARVACQNWVEGLPENTVPSSLKRQEGYSYGSEATSNWGGDPIYDIGGDEYKIKGRCEFEQDTRQFLGYQMELDSSAKKGFKAKLLKHFRY